MPSVGVVSVEPGALLAGRYRLAELLGRGGMGEVWRAQDELLRRPVAVKRLLPDVNRAVQDGALGEARAAAAICHPGVVTVYDLLATGDDSWIVMELLHGRTLADAVRMDGPLPVAAVARIGLSLLDVLRAVHRAGLVHRDVTPANVYLCTDGRVVLTDFGIACVTGNSDGLADGEFAGSPAYVPPEIVRGGPVGPASDLFSLGATLFTAVEGRAAFDKGAPVDTISAVLSDTREPFRRAGHLRRVIAALLATEPHRRPSADQVGAALRACHAATVAASSPHRRARRPPRPGDGRV